MISICSGEAFLPARRVAGSEAGRTLNIANTTAVTITSRRIAPRRRLTM
jgi:hypothetical protein